MHVYLEVDISKLEVHCIRFSDLKLSVVAWVKEYGIHFIYLFILSKQFKQFIFFYRQNNSSSIYKVRIKQVV